MLPSMFGKTMKPVVKNTDVNPETTELSLMPASGVFQKKTDFIHPKGSTQLNLVLQPRQVDLSERNQKLNWFLEKIKTFREPRMSSPSKMHIDAIGGWQ